jgi:hypothetical protein
LVHSKAHGFVSSMAAFDHGRVEQLGQTAHNPRT